MVLTKKDSIISYNRQCQQFFCNEVDSGPGCDLFKDFRANQKKTFWILIEYYQMLVECAHVYFYMSYPLENMQKHQPEHAKFTKQVVTTLPEF